MDSHRQSIFAKLRSSLKHVTAAKCTKSHPLVPRSQPQWARRRSASIFPGPRSWRACRGLLATGPGRSGLLQTHRGWCCNSKQAWNASTAPQLHQLGLSNHADSHVWKGLRSADPGWGHSDHLTNAHHQTITGKKTAHMSTTNTHEL